MFGLCIALLAYGLSLGGGSGELVLTHKKENPAAPVKKQSTWSPTLHPTRIPTPTAQTHQGDLNTQQKTSAFNRASEKNVQSVSTQAIEHSPVLDECTTDCKRQLPVLITATPTPNASPTNIPEVTPTFVLPSVDPCPPYKDQRLEKANGERSDFIPCLHAY